MAPLETIPGEAGPIKQEVDSKMIRALGETLMLVADDDSRPAAMDAVFAAAFGSGRQAMTEGDLVAVILAECRRLGITRVYRTPRADRAGVSSGGRGFPDLVIAAPAGMVMRECKSRGGETSADQDDWGWHLHRAGVDWAIWRPEDWHSGRIRAELRQLAGQ